MSANAWFECCSRATIYLRDQTAAEVAIRSGEILTTFNLTLLEGGGEDGSSLENNMKRVSFLALLALLCAGISTPAQAQEHPGIQQKDTSWFAYDDAMTAAFLGGGGGDPVAACKAACNAT